MKLKITGATVVDPAAGTVQQQDIYVDGGRIATPFADPAQILDGTGCYLLPGLIDLHVHFRDPGQTQKEDLVSGAAAAVSGGVTQVVAMPNTAPVVDSPAILADLNNRGAKLPIRFHQAACITLGMKSQTLTDFAALKAAGAAALSDDGLPVMSADLMKAALVQARAVGLPVLSHSEIFELDKGGKMHEGAVSAELGLQGMPRRAEYEAIQREITLAEQTGCPVHICHVSTGESVELVRRAKARGVPVTCETGPHYFTFTHEELYRKDADYRMNPPLREDSDREAILSGLADGTIDAIATDHAPHAAAEKADFAAAPNGVIGLQTSLAASYTALVDTGLLSILQLAEKMSLIPAGILGVPGGSLAEGEPADLTLFDPSVSWTVEPAQLAGKSKNTPFKGRTLQGKVKATVCRGEIVYLSNN